MTPPGRGLRRRTAAAGAAVAIALLAGVVTLADGLGRPTPTTGPPRPVTGAVQTDGRGAPGLDDEGARCPLPASQEGRERPVEAGPQTTQRVGSTLLLLCPQHWDGRPVRMVGEVVGLVLRDGEEVWLQLNDGAHAGELSRPGSPPGLRGGNAGIGGLVPADQAERIGAVGGPGRRGDVVEAEGTFRRVTDSAEVAILEVSSLAVLQPGGPLTPPTTAGQAPAALASLGVAAAVGLAVRRARRT